MESILQRECSLPILHVRGSYYQVGFNVGRTFCGMINTLIDILCDSYIPVYETVQGKTVYEETLKCVTEVYPQYVKELQGISDGAGIPFHKEIIGHTEDALKEVTNNIFIINAQYTESQNQEHFMAFCYAGLLPGYAMGFNKHGLIYSMNIIGAKHLGRGKLPRTFVTRALLAADSFDEAMRVLQCRGIGIADAMSVNLTFLNQKTDRIFYNIEVGPNGQSSDRAAIDVQRIHPGDVSFHANKFLRLDISEVEGGLLVSSNARHETREGYDVSDRQSVYELLSDTSNPTCGIFRETGRVRTVAVDWRFVPLWLVQCGQIVAEEIMKTSYSLENDMICKVLLSNTHPQGSTYPGNLLLYLLGPLRYAKFDLNVIYLQKYRRVYKPKLETVLHK